MHRLHQQNPPTQGVPPPFSRTPPPPTHTHHLRSTTPQRPSSVLWGGCPSSRSFCRSDAGIVQCALMPQGRGPGPCAMAMPQPIPWARRPPCLACTRARPPPPPPPTSAGGGGRTRCRCIVVPPSATCYGLTCHCPGPVPHPCAMGGVCPPPPPSYDPRPRPVPRLPVRPKGHTAPGPGLYTAAGPRPGGVTSCGSGGRGGEGLCPRAHAFGHAPAVRRPFGLGEHWLVPGGGGALEAPLPFWAPVTATPQRADRGRGC